MASKTKYRIVPYMQTEARPTRSAIESLCPFGGHYRLTGIYETEEYAKAEVARRKMADVDQEKKMRMTILMRNGR